MSDFAFDYVVKDKENHVRVDVTLAEKDDSHIMFAISTPHWGPRITFSLSIDKAAELGHAISCAAAGDHPSQVGIGIELIRAIKGSQP